MKPIDYRPIREPIETSVLRDGGTVEMSVQSEVRAGGNYLFFYDEIESWLYEWAEWHPGFDIRSTENYFSHALNFTLTYECYLDIPRIVKAFTWWVNHLLTCIYWHECPVCGRMCFTFYDPFDLNVDLIESCDCTPEEVAEMNLMIQEENSTNEFKIIDDAVNNPDLVFFRPFIRSRTVDV